MGEGIAVTGVAWRSSIAGWVCSRCGMLFHTSEELEDLDPVSGEWQPRIRRSVGVPVAGQRLQVVVMAGASLSWNPVGINLSTTGILVEFPPDLVPRELECGVGVKVALRFEAHAIMLDAEVKRRDGRQYGIAFCPTVDNEASFKPDPLRMMVAALEQRWLAARAR